MNCLKVAKFLETGTIRSDSYSKFGYMREPPVESGATY